MLDTLDKQRRMLADTALFLRGNFRPVFSSVRVSHCYAMFLARLSDRTKIEYAGINTVVAQDLYICMLQL
jgi:hypothetical protein